MTTIGCGDWAWDCGTVKQRLLMSVAHLIVIPVQVFLDFAIVVFQNMVTEGEIR
jgi:hypothetical protein